MSARGSPSASSPHPPHGELSAKGTNPLRRTSDRIESWFLRFLMLVLVLGVPVASINAGLMAYHSSLRAVHTQSADRRETTAWLTADAKGTQRSAEDAWQQAQVRWTDKTGKQQTGTTLVQTGTPKGATIRIWLNQDGTLGDPPMTVDGAKATGWLVGSMTAVGVASGLLAARAGMRLALDRRRYAQWDAEWEAVEPGWSARFRR
ncbi:Rv1733c family protein [Streptomyces sp. A1-5]|uniref:Rv1733c family protein n=1 Tax=Streptomyces sp. A1-5 TaxID=2738410 RepID=UPI001F387F80|nr:hypothetical protein HRD51_04110 [Streptomyces sp. A1-5]